MRFAVLAGVLVALWAPPWEAQQVSYEGSLSASTGTYIFTERTNSFALSTGLYLKTAGCHSGPPCRSGCRIRR